MAQETMTREAFREFVKAEVLDYLPDNYETFIQEVSKPAGAYIAVGAREKGTNISPVINVDSFYEKYQGGECLVDMLKQIADIFMNAQRPQIQANDVMAWLNDYSTVKGKLFVKAMNAERLPAKTLRKEIEDIALVPYILVQKDENGLMATAVTTDFFDNWDVTIDDIISDAFLNGEELFPARVDDIREILGMPEDEGEPMLVVTNEGRTGGAAALFYPCMMERISKMLGGDFIVLPSSTDEVIAIRCGGEVDMLKRMIMQVNEKQVAPEERLSNSVYRYDAETKTLVKEG